MMRNFVAIRNEPYKLRKIIKNQIVWKIKIADIKKYQKFDQVCKKSKFQDFGKNVRTKQCNMMVHYKE